MIEQRLRRLINHTDFFFADAVILHHVALCRLANSHDARSVAASVARFEVINAPVDRMIHLWERMPSYVVHCYDRGDAPPHQADGQFVTQAVKQIDAIFGSAAGQAESAPKTSRKQSPRAHNAATIAPDIRLRLLRSAHLGRIKQVQIFRIVFQLSVQQRPTVVSQSGKVVKQPLGVVSNSHKVVFNRGRKYANLSF